MFVAQKKLQGVWESRILGDRWKISNWLFDISLALRHQQHSKSGREGYKRVLQFQGYLHDMVAAPLCFGRCADNETV
jgi:hypothetical protein